MSPATAPAALRDRLCGGFSVVQLAVAVSVAPPDYLSAVVTGLDVAKARDDASVLACFVGGRYHRRNPLGGPTEIEQHRYPPHGDRDRWVADGPPGHRNHPGTDTGPARSATSAEEDR